MVHSPSHIFLDIFGVFVEHFYLIEEDIFFCYRWDLNLWLLDALLLEYAKPLSQYLEILAQWFSIF